MLFLRIFRFQQTLIQPWYGLAQVPGLTCLHISRTCETSAKCRAIDFSATKCVLSTSSNDWMRSGRLTADNSKEIDGKKSIVRDFRINGNPPSCTHSNVRERFLIARSNDMIVLDSLENSTIRKRSETLLCVHSPVCCTLSWSSQIRFWAPSHHRNTWCITIILRLVQYSYLRDIKIQHKLDF